jgi:hypothetical protein
LRRCCMSQREFGNLGDLDGFPDLATISAGGRHSSNQGGARSRTDERHGSGTKAILRMNSGGLSNHSFPQAGSAAGHEPRTSARCSTRSSTCCERDVPGDSCPTTFHRRGQSTLTFEHGPVMEHSNGFTRPFVNGFALQRAETRSRALHASTVNRRKRTNKGGSIGTMPAKRSWGASVTSWWIAWG